MKYKSRRDKSDNGWLEEGARGQVYVHHRAHAKEVLLEKLGQNVECRKLTAVLYNKTI